MSTVKWILTRVPQQFHGERIIVPTSGAEYRKSWTSSPLSHHTQKLTQKMFALLFFPGGPVVNNLPFNAGMQFRSLVEELRSQMAQGNWAHILQLQSHAQAHHNQRSPHAEQRPDAAKNRYFLKIKTSAFWETIKNMQAIALEKILKIQISEKRFIFRTYNKLVIQKQEDKKKTGRQTSYKNRQRIWVDTSQKMM